MKAQSSQTRAEMVAEETHRHIGPVPKRTRMKTWTRLVIMGAGLSMLSLLAESKPWSAAVEDAEFKPATS
jgi:hypothetical protein